jgi:hypothetical protein
MMTAKNRFEALRRARALGAWVKLDYVQLGLNEEDTLAYLRRYKVDVKERGGALWIRGTGNLTPAPSVARERSS